MFEGNGEILDDIVRHGNHDVVWCFLYERLVSTYVNIKSNNKENEISFTNFHRRKLLTWVLSHIQEDRDGLLPHQRLYQKLHSALMAPQGYLVDSSSHNECQVWHRYGILKVSSILKAKDIWNAHLAHGVGYPCGKSMHEKGIIIGPKRQTWRLPSSEEQRFMSQRGYNATKVQQHQKIWFKGDVFKIGDTVVIKSDDYCTDPSNVGEWKARIKSFFSMQCQEDFKLFFGAEYYRQSILVEGNNERLNVDPITGMSVLQHTPMPFTWDCIREVGALLHKFIPWRFQNSIIAYELKDPGVRKRLLNVGCVGCVPPWLEEKDIVQIREHEDYDSTTQGLSYAVVREVNSETTKVRLTILQPVNNRNEQWKTRVEDNNWKDMTCCLAIVPGWKVLKLKRVIEDGKSKILPCMWQA